LKNFLVIILTLLFISPTFAASKKSLPPTPPATQEEKPTQISCYRAGSFIDVNKQNGLELVFWAESDSRINMVFVNPRSLKWVIAFVPNIMPNAVCIYDSDKRGFTIDPLAHIDSI